MDAAGIDILLVGDSVGMVVHGHDTTLPVTLEDMLLHCRAVSRGARRRGPALPPAWCGARGRAHAARRARGRAAALLRRDPQHAHARRACARAAPWSQSRSAAASLRVPGCPAALSIATACAGMPRRCALAAANLAAGHKRERAGRGSLLPALSDEDCGRLTGRFTIALCRTALRRAARGAQAAAGGRPAVRDVRGVAGDGGALRRAPAEGGHHGRREAGRRARPSTRRVRDRFSTAVKHVRGRACQPSLAAVAPTPRHPTDMTLLHLCMG